MSISKKKQKEATPERIRIIFVHVNKLLLLFIENKEFRYLTHISIHPSLYFSIKLSSFFINYF